jgi:uncharacterized protein YggE
LAAIAPVALAAAFLAPLAAPAPAAAQATPVGAPAEPPTVSVVGEGRVTVPPDTAAIVAGVDVTRPTLAEAQAEADDQATAIIDAARAEGIAEDDIQTVNYSVNVVREFDEQGNPGAITGYQVANQVELTIRDVDGVGGVLDAVVDAGANNIYGITFYLEDTAAAASQARAAAVRDARAKAEELATAAGASLGRVRSITEGIGPAPAPQIFAAEANAAAGRAGGAPIQVGTNEVLVTVQMTFELE